MYQEALAERSAPLFPRLARFSGFYLVGGTALALHIGHRRSIDFDLFSESALPPTLLGKVKRTFPDSSIQVTYRIPEQLNVLIDSVKTTFFFYEYPVLDRMEKFQDVPVASICEIAAMKAFAIGKRLSYKDYVDWYFLLKEHHVTLRETIGLAKKKFGGDFNDRLFLGQLVSFKDVPTQKIDFLRNAIARPALERFLKKTVRQFALMEVTS